MKPNHLHQESSPYLKQHAHNPVEWYPWGEEALSKAFDEDKPIILSIGYSTCHWCHVMERESFEDETIAKYMNEHFISIKVDREERPDVDQIYMDALGVMGVQGGWPLNVFLLPNKQPFYGGTYFPAKGWLSLLQNIIDAYQTKRDALDESAENFTKSLNVDSIMKYSAGDSAGFKAEVIETIYSRLRQSFDFKNGGTSGAPKFPMPSIWLYVVLYARYLKNDEAESQLVLTLDKMAMGGIYDQIGGGFARYSTDDQWFAPHFEKMLYDNGQLLSIYSKGFEINQSVLYKHVVHQTVDWLEREMLDQNGGFYSALDADSEGVEGKFYVWTEDELREVLGSGYELVKIYYNVESQGNWESGVNILHRRFSDQALAEESGIDLEELNSSINDSNSKLLKARSERIRPGLDSKIISGWNAIMSIGLIDAYTAFGDERYLTLANKNIDFILNDMSNENLIYHVQGKKIHGFLDDYGLVIEALIKLYQSTFKEGYIQKSKDLMDYVLDTFYDEHNHFFFYTSRKSEKLIADKKELFDNVIPSSNAIMAGNLYFLGLIYDDLHYLDMARLMVKKVSGMIAKESRYMSKWAVLYHIMLNRPAEVVIIGAGAAELAVKIQQKSPYSVICMGTENSSSLPLLKNRIQIDDKTTIYVCRNKVCQLPVQNVDQALEQITSTHQ